MSTIAPVISNEVEIFRRGSRTTQKIVNLTMDGMSQADSLQHPEPAGNCTNWVMGHLVCVYNEILPVLEQPPLMDRAALKQYARGAAPLTNPAEARPIDTLMKEWDEACDRIDRGLAGLSEEALHAAAPMSPVNDPNETVCSLLGLITFHQAYHAGQLALLRRIVGKPGVIG